MRFASAHVLIGLSGLLLVSCAHKYAIPEHSQVKFPDESLIYVALPGDGRDDGGRQYDGSGEAVQAALGSALQARDLKLILGAGRGETDDAARQSGALFIVIPRIVHWSDRATEWSGIPDRITISIEVRDLANDKRLDRQELRASSRWATFGGDHPQELLPGGARLAWHFAKLGAFRF